MRLAVLIPAHNEAKTVGEIVREAKRHADLVLVVDDGSTDETGTIARKAGAKVVRNERNMGLGVALRKGFREALKYEWDVIVTLDADGQHDPKEIPKLVKEIEKGAEVVIGERDLSSYPFVKRLGNFFLNILTNFLAGTNIGDTESGFRALRRDALELMLPEMRARHYEVASEMILLIGKHRLKYANVGVSSPIYVKGVTIVDGVKNFLYILRRRNLRTRDYVRGLLLLPKLFLRKLMRSSSKTRGHPRTCRCC